ncbi:MAG: STAS domain-containing protein [Planctomycetaceae bacterium]
MITSYVTPQRSVLYLALVGPLNEYAANDLVQEYYERHARGLRQCVLDLSAVDYTDPDGLNALHRIALLCEVDSIGFTVACRGSLVEPEIRAGADRYWVAVAEGVDLPFLKKAI